jgi:hypothetical protein
MRCGNNYRCHNCFRSFNAEKFQEDQKVEVVKRMNAKEAQLAAKMLKDYSDNLGENDWKFPEGWTILDKTDFVRDFYIFNNTPEEFDPKNLQLSDYQVAALLSSKLLLLAGGK